MLSSPDPLRKYGSVDKRNSPWQGFVTYSSDYTPSVPQSQLLWTLLIWGNQHLVHSSHHLNGEAVLLSRGRVQDRKWHLHPWIVAHFWDQFGRANFDLFMPAEHAHYFSPCLMYGQGPCCTCSHR